jgi:two-component system, LytTR family, sensor kinase
MFMSKKRIYWTLQILGWTLLIMFEYVPYVLEYGFKLTEFYSALANILLGICLTHAYRLVIRRWNWSSLPLPRLALRVIGSVLWLGLIMTMINQPMDREILEHNLLNQPLIFWSYYANWCKNLVGWILSYTVYHYVEQNRLASYEKIMLKMSMREAEAKVLRSQLNPHFTFNALNSIRALVYEDPKRAQLSITQLSNILRNSLLADRRKTVDLQEELRTVEDYLELEKVRYEDRLSYSITTNPQAIYWQVPPMMLQTLVENGIKHGVAKQMGGGFIGLKSEIANELLVITIHNSGNLGDTEVNAGNLGNTESGGVGLKNTAERLSILYGKAATFRIFQEKENVVCSEIKIPMLSEGVMMVGEESGKEN